MNPQESKTSDSTQSMLWASFFAKHEAIWWAFVSICSLITFILIYREIAFAGAWSKLQVFDRNVLYASLSLRNAPTIQFMNDMTTLGSRNFLFLVFATGVFGLMAAGKRRELLHFVILFVGVAFLPDFLKTLVLRNRPEEIYRLVYVTSTSFPSSHAFAAAATYGSLSFMASRTFKKRWCEFAFGLLALAACLLVCISRVYLGAHFVSDVLGGAIAGITWSTFLFSIVCHLDSAQLKKSKASL